MVSEKHVLILFYQGQASKNEPEKGVKKFQNQTFVFFEKSIDNFLPLKTKGF